MDDNVVRSRAIYLTMDMRIHTVRCLKGSSGSKFHWPVSIAFWTRVLYAFSAATGNLFRPVPCGQAAGQQRLTKRGWMLKKMRLGSIQGWFKSSFWHSTSWYFYIKGALWHTSCVCASLCAFSTTSQYCGASKKKKSLLKSRVQTYIIYILKREIWEKNQHVGGKASCLTPKRTLQMWKPSQGQTVTERKGRPSRYP